MKEQSKGFQWWKVYIIAWGVIMLSMFYFIHLQNMEIATMFKETDIKINEARIHLDSLKIEGDKFLDSLEHIHIKIPQ